MVASAVVWVDLVAGVGLRRTGLVVIDGPAHARSCGEGEDDMLPTLQRMGRSRELGGLVACNDEE